MAKRKRLTPASPAFLSEDPGPQNRAAPPLTSSDKSAERGAEMPLEIAPEELPRDLETKGMFSFGGRSQASARPPIAQVSGEASARAALDELTRSIHRVRIEGRMIEELVAGQIEAGHLVRDRLGSDPDDMASLVASLRARGQQTPLEVLDRGEGAQPRYGLISGWRRLAGLRHIATEAGQDPDQARVLVLVRQPASAADAYVAMVEENEIRSDISFYERARIVTKALEQGVYDSPKAALNSLFGNVSRAKRSKIKSFMRIVEALDGALRFPAALSERAGLDLVHRLEADPALGPALAAALLKDPAPSAEAELARLAAAGPDRAQGDEADTPATGAKTAPSDPGPKADRGALPSLQLDDARQTIVISGPGVDAALLKDLRLWLTRRGA